jgi:hypothetical protein
MDEANQRLQEALSELQGISPGAVVTEAKRLARKAIKAQWQAQGRKVAWVEHSELVGGGQGLSRSASSRANQPSSCKSFK